MAAEAVGAWLANGYTGGLKVEVRHCQFLCLWVCSCQCIV